MRDWLSEEYQNEEEPFADDYDDDPEWASWLHVHGLWLAHDKKCICGREITLDDAYYFGRCDACQEASRQAVPF